jgi:hypothetical protein
MLVALWQIQSETGSTKYIRMVTDGSDNIAAP